MGLWDTWYYFTCIFFYLIPQFTSLRLNISIYFFSDPQNFNQPNTSGAQTGNGNENKSSRSHRSGESSLSNSNTQGPSKYYQPRKLSTKQNNQSGENRRQVNIEQSKAEGRKKLLQFFAQRDDSQGQWRGRFLTYNFGKTPIT